MVKGMARITTGVGPRSPQVVVLFGATGDLSRRKLLPGLFHLAASGFIPACRIIGVSLDELDADGFRAVASARRGRASARASSLMRSGTPSASGLDYVPLGAGPAALRPRWNAPNNPSAPDAGACTTSVCRLTRRCPRCRCWRDAGLVAGSRIIMEKPFGTDLASAVALNSAAA